MPWLLVLLIGGGAYFAYSEISASSSQPSTSSIAQAVSIALAKETNPQNLSDFAAALLPVNAALSAKLSARAAVLTNLANGNFQAAPTTQKQVSSNITKNATHFTSA